MFVYPLGLALGAVPVTVADLAERHGPVREGLLDRTGFRTVYTTPDDVDSLTLSLEAARAHGVDWVQQVDGVVSVGSTPRLSAPGNAHLIAQELEVRADSLLLDINDACTGFVRSLVVVDSLLKTGAASAVLLVLADTYTKLYAESDLKLSPLFSDGASALLITAAALDAAPAGYEGRQWEIASTAFISDGSGSPELCITPRTDDSHGALTMNGSAVLNFVLRHVRGVTGSLAEESRIPVAEVDDWYVHQGSRMVVDAVAKAVGRSGDELFRAADYGNIVGSSLPAQFFDAPAAERSIGLLGFGVGLTMGGVFVRESPIRG